MTEHISTWRMQRFCGSALSEAESATITEHLCQCQACHQLFADTVRQQTGSVPVSFNLAPEFWLGHEHLDYEQLVQIANQKLDATERQMIDAHLRICATCREDVRSFLGMRDDIAADVSARYAPRAQERSRRGLPPWSWWRAVGWKPAYAAAVVLITIALVVGVVLLRRRAANLQAHQTSPPQPTPGAISQTETPATGSPAPGPAQTPYQEQPTKIETPNAPKGPGAVEEARNRGPSIQPITLSDGERQIGLDEHGNLVGVSSLSARSQQQVKAVLQTQDLKYPALMKGLKGQARTLLGQTEEGAPFALLAPVGSVVLTNRPTFRWRSLEGVSSYTASIFDSDANEIEASPSLTVTEWTATRPLPRGRVYIWQVTAIKDGKEVTSHVLPAPPAKFRVLDQVQANEIEQAMGVSPPSHFTLGVLYANAGLLNQAEKEFRLLAAANRNNPLIPKLLHRVQSFRVR
jgi:hypothetical protein